MKKFILGSLVIIMFAMFTVPIAEAVSFNDVPSNHWAKKYIDLVSNKGVMNGTGGGNFSPDAAINRGDFVTVLGAVAGIDTSLYGSSVYTPFTDISGKYYATRVRWAYSKGIILGTSPTIFSADTTITRENVCVVIDRYCNQSNITLTSNKTYVNFTDQSSISSHAVEAIRRLFMAGMVVGNGNNFRPHSPATRAELAAMIYHLLV